MATSTNSPRACITFLTDFGTQDTYVGQMKGVAWSINPGLQLIDLTHEIPPQDILRAAFVWKDAISAFPDDVIHVGVVDPGVGSERRLVAAEIGNHRFVCPDNGLLTVILQQSEVQRVVHLDNPQWRRKDVSNTFHGRDILTPAAAAWSLGHDLNELGTPLKTPLVTLPLAVVARGRASLNGQVINIDRFGNLITNIGSLDIPANSTSVQIEFGGFRIGGISDCYSNVEPGEVLAHVGSAGRIEIAIRNGSAADELQATCGRSVIVRWKEGTE